MAALKAPQCAGLVQVEEGEYLARLASKVPTGQAIVEIGSHTGLSTCWMAASAHTSHVTAVDPWADPRPDTLEDPFELLTGDAVYERFAANIASEKLWQRVTPLRTTSMVAAQLWVQPIGLLFVDAIHEYEAVRTDYLHWQAFIPVGGYIAFHDYTTDPEHPYHGVARAIADWVPAEQWSEPVIRGYMWTARRILAP